MDNDRLFRFKLASHLKMTVAELEARMDHKEYKEWQEYYSIEPFDPDRVELMLAQVISALSGAPAFETMITLSEEMKEAQRQKALQDKISATFEGL